MTTSAVEFDSQISPDGEWLSFISTAAGASRIMVQRIDGGEARPLTLAAGEPISQVWSPDGKQIAAVLVLDGKHVLQVYPAFFGGEPALTIALGELQTVDLRRWIDRDLYLEIRTRLGLFFRRLSLDPPYTANDLNTAWTIDGTLRGVDVRPDGRAAVISVIKNNQEDLWTLNVDGSALRRLTDDAYFDKDPRWIGRGDSVVFQSNRGGQLDLWQVDVRSKAMTALTSGEAEDVVDSTSIDGTTISFRQLTKDANLWAFGAGAPQQLTQDSLSDYSPVLSGDGRVLAFQRSQPTPSSGYTILDAKVFVSPFDGRPVIDARSIADGFAADLSNDGQWLAYMQMSERPARMALSVRDLRGGVTLAVSSSAALPSLALTPVEWSTRLTAWSQSGADLYFVDQPEVCTIRRYSTATAAAGPPLVTAAQDVYIRDLYMSPETGRLGYLTAVPRAAVTVHELDPVNGSVRDLATFDGEDKGRGIAGRGWLDREFVLVRTTRLHEDCVV